jgi:hypothetical protein
VEGGTSEVPPPLGKYPLWAKYSYLPVLGIGISWLEKNSGFFISEQLPRIELLKIRISNP